MFYYRKINRSTYRATNVWQLGDIHLADVPSHDLGDWIKRVFALSRRQGHIQHRLGKRNLQNDVLHLNNNNNPTTIDTRDIIIICSIHTNFGPSFSGPPFSTHSIWCFIVNYAFSSFCFVLVVHFCRSGVEMTGSGFFYIPTPSHSHWESHSYGHL